jgi:hypothetical protein
MDSPPHLFPSPAWQLSRWRPTNHCTFFLHPTSSSNSFLSFVIVKSYEIGRNNSNNFQIKYSFWKMCFTSSSRLDTLSLCVLPDSWIDMLYRNERLIYNKINRDKTLKIASIVSLLTGLLSVIQTLQYSQYFLALDFQYSDISLFLYSATNERPFNSEIFICCINKYNNYSNSSAKCFNLSTN